MDIINEFFTGHVSPAWPHFWLLTVAFLGSAAVAWGIVREAERKWSLTTLLVVGGVAIEAVCTLLLFGFDEGISNAQQSKIATLYGRLAARTLSDDDIKRLREVLTPFGPHEFSIETYWNVSEPTNLTHQIGDKVLIPNGWRFTRGGVLVGVVAGIIVSEPPDETGRMAVKTLIDGLANAGIDAKLEPNAGVSRIDIVVGIKP